MSEEIKKIEKEIASLKNRQRIRYALVFTFLFLALYFTVHLLFTVLSGEATLMGFLKSFGWGKWLWMGGCWFGYELLARRFRQKQLYKKEAELAYFQNA